MAGRYAGIQKPLAAGSFTPTPDQADRAAKAKARALKRQPQPSGTRSRPAYGYLPNYQPRGEVQGGGARPLRNPPPIGRGGRV